MNSARITALGVDSKVLKELTFLFSFVLVFFFIVSVARTPRTVDLMLKVLVGGGALIAMLAVVEARIGYTRSIVSAPPTRRAGGGRRRRNARGQRTRVRAGAAPDRV